MPIFRENLFDKIFQFIEKYYFIFLVALLSMASFNVFFNLGKTPIDSWDEARHGISAYEMIKNNDFIVNTFGYAKDYWNLKPPLSFWAISLGYKLVGFNALGLRFFSATAALLTIAMVALFTKARYGKLASLIATAVLATTTQYILSHSARTGDADALHVFFFTMAILCVYFIHRNTRWLYVAGFFFALSFLTKSWHALTILGVIGLYSLLSGTFFRLKVKEWGLFLASSIFPILFWGTLRYQKDGLTFMEQMISYDLLSRTSNTLEGHVGGPSYYLVTLQYNTLGWIMILAGCLFVCLFLYANQSTKKSKNDILLLSLWVLVPLIFYTVAKTKITWYMLPIYPAMAISIGALAHKLLQGHRRNFVLQLVLSVSVFLTAYTYERFIIKNISDVHPDPLQSTLQQLNTLDGYAGSFMYTLCGTDGFPASWKQCDLLCAELYGDMRPKNGGLEAFLKDKEAQLILVPKSKECMDQVKPYGLKKVLETSTNYILSKSH